MRNYGAAIMNFPFLVLSVMLVFSYMALTDGTNFQALGGIIMLAVVSAFFWSRKGRRVRRVQTQIDASIDEARRRFMMAGAVSGGVSYFGYFLSQRVPMGKMVAYKPTLEPIDIELKLDAQPSFSLSRPQPTLVDGPYYSFGTPEARSIAREGTEGLPIIFQGRVVDETGEPVEGIAIEIWHADGNGEYDNVGFNCRGHQFTNTQGCFEFQTVMPFGYGQRSLSTEGVLDFRSAHFHVKLMRDGHTWTSQVWFPDDPRNSGDIAFQVYKDIAIVNQKEIDGKLYCRFDFIV